MAEFSPFQVRAPARLCLFGEHSDYLGLDVIPSAISLAITIDATPRGDKEIRIKYTDLDEVDQFELGHELPYRHSRDYVRSAFNVCLREFPSLESGWDLVITGDIPLAAGLSSSSALSVGMVLAIAQMCGVQLSTERVVELGFEAEVTEFDESGGMQDHYAIGYGGIIHLDLGNDYRVTRLPAQLNGLVIGDSQESKTDTVGDITHIKSTVEQEYSVVSEKIEFDRRTTSVNRVYGLSRSRPSRSRTMMEATLRNRDITARAFELLQQRNPDPEKVGELLNEEHMQLRDGLQRSTPKIENMIEAALSSGALGCKVNGSGGGGTMLAYAPGLEEEVSKAIAEAGGVSFKVDISQGASVQMKPE
ncbi:MAG: hypothetical protein BAJATHORv1_70109 [Candidatus Thorarchaeota archaeon]|nr:MAG: hypothetical protein BAJATHORv1_70109 [Candidatus Thorarchaeota archaeon]